MVLTHQSRLPKELLQTGLQWTLLIPSVSPFLVSKALCVKLANIFLDNLVNAIVQTEAQMHFSTQCPFSEPLARYLDCYPAKDIDFFL